MEKIKLRNMPLSVKIFVSLMLCIAGLSYLTLLGSIYIDTDLKVVNIIKGYADMEYMELTAHSFKYIFWFFGMFSIVGASFLLTSYSEKVKRVFATIVPLFIVSDIGSMWLVSKSHWFAYQLFASGAVLATSFLTMFLLAQYEIWIIGAENKQIIDSADYFKVAKDSHVGSKFIKGKKADHKVNGANKTSKR